MLPISLTFLPFVKIKSLHSILKTYVIFNTLKAWQDVKKFCGSSARISLLAPLSSNPDLPSSIAKSLLTKWKDHGLHNFKDLFNEGRLKSFSDSRSEFKIPKQDFYKYLQIRHLITTLERSGRLCLGLASLEEILAKRSGMQPKWRSMGCYMSKCIYITVL